MKHRTIGVSEFKSNCLALLDEIAEEGGTITVTKRGKPIATVGPVHKKSAKPLKGLFKGRGRIVGDIVNTSYLWAVPDPDPTEGQ